MLRLVAVSCSALSLAALMNISAFAQQKAVDSPLKGAWRVSEILEGPGAPNTSPFPSLYVFTDRHYSVMAVIGARPKFAPGKATHAEKIATLESGWWWPATDLSTRDGGKNQRRFNVSTSR